MNINLDSRDSKILKGLAITAIVFHNFFHLVSRARENEISFDPGRFQQFLVEVRQPELAIQALFSFWGHYGVQIFVFLSAYGLAKSHWDDTESWYEFMSGRVRKLYPIFALVIVPWMFADSVLIGPLQFAKHVAPQTGLMLLGVSTFFGDPAPIGPWWFIPFILQFYAIWPLLRRLTIRFGWRGLVILAIACFAITCAVNPLLARWSLNLLLTPFGRMKGICFGILAARYPIRIDKTVAMLALAVALLGSRYEALWPLTAFAVLLVALWTYMNLRDRLRRSWLLERLGEYSLLIFLLNALVRSRLVMYVTSPASCLLLAAVSAAVSFAMAAAIQEFAFPPPRPLKPREVPDMVAYPLRERALQSVADG